MTLFRIAMQNVKNSFFNYLMYFISIVFSVFVFFSFKSIEYNEALSSLGEKTRMSINTSSIVIVVFVFLFIYYSNSFFFNRRRREVGTYSLLGMRKNQIGKIFHNLVYNSARVWVSQLRCIKNILIATPSC